MSRRSKPPVNPAAPASEQDPRRRLGNYATAGEAPIKQPGGTNDSHRKPHDVRGSGRRTPKPTQR
jgi:hypothetical protein